MIVTLVVGGPLCSKTERRGGCSSGVSQGCFRDLSLEEPTKIIARLQIQTAEGKTLSLILTLRPDAKMLGTVEGGGGERKGRFKALRACVPAFRLCVSL